VICEKNITSEVTVFSVQECVIKKCLTNHFAYTLYFPLNIKNPTILKNELTLAVVFKQIVFVNELYAFT